ncbi:hypothetical protein HDU82_007968 [Entophlyctis luteolus]|nr:hypothetical protein HDU82_007968 [Entophlyctis luteolus]
MPGVWVRPVENKTPVMRNHDFPHALLYLHGGGYCKGTPKLYVSMCGRLIQKYNKHDPTSRGLIVFCAQYPLTPEHTFEEILEASVNAYIGLVRLGYQKISVAGDSAGGNAALNLVAILKTEHPEVVQPYSSVLLCPWVDPHIEVLPPELHDAHCSEFDVISVESSRRMAAKLSSVTAAAKFRVAPLKWDAEHLRRSVPQAKGMFILHSGGDVLRGGVDAFVDKVREAVGPGALMSMREQFGCHVYITMYLLVPSPKGRRLALDAVERIAACLVSLHD